ncbi:MAG TPA: ATP-binding protein [Thermoanaerobaculia bacterium]|nr:ATP-binding protein [Thermoanaerobaculia bacterium]
MRPALLTVDIRQEADVVVARQRSRQLARLLGFDAQDQVRIATAVSEIARNVYQYAGRGRIEFQLEGRTPPQVFVARLTDQGPGIADVPLILSGRYRSQTGMGLGITGARRLMDQLQIESAPGKGTTVWLKKLLPAGAPYLDGPRLAAVGDALAREGFQNPLAEVQNQNQELLRALGELRNRQDELLRVNRELEDTNRGVVALYAELDEKAEHLRRADEMKSRFLSNMSHEFRTPLNSILALSRLLEERTDGELTGEQAKQVGFIKKAAGDLTELVNDLLDLAKVEAGKTVVRPIEFEARNLFGALRGMLRPLLVAESVNLVFEDQADLAPLYTDEAKVSQILRNFISNALKFTERGEIRVSATLSHDLDGGVEGVCFAVADTGIGIAPEDHERIFREFDQVEGRLQAKFKGTGLGLALSKRLAELLGGRITLESTLGAGSTFSLTIPRVYESDEPVEEEPLAEEWHPDPRRLPVLIVDDSPESLHVYERLLRDTPFQPVSTRTLREAAARLRTVHPAAIVLDIQLVGEQTWSFLAGLKGADETRDIPVLVITSVDDPAKAAALAADGYCDKPVDRDWLLERLGSLTRKAGKALIIDDEEASRYILKGLVVRLPLEPVESSDGREGLRRAREERPDVILLDLVMPGLTGFDVLDELRADPSTREIPVVVSTSKILAQEERQRLERWSVPVLSKETWARPDAVTELRQALSRAGWSSGSAEERA